MNVINKHPFLIGEISFNYYDLAEKENVHYIQMAKFLVEKCIESGLDGVNFHVGDSEYLHCNYEDDSNISDKLTFDEYKKLADYSKELGLAFIITPDNKEIVNHKDGVRYHHIIDPKTGRPASNGAISITVIVDGSYADAGMISDLLTTAVFIMGPEQGRKFLQELSSKTAGAICDNKYTLWITPAFSQHLHQLDKNFSLNIEDKKALGN